MQVVNVVVHVVRQGDVEQNSRFEAHLGRAASEIIHKLKEFITNCILQLDLQAV
jgi:hypothetical protein